MRVSVNFDFARPPLEVVVPAHELTPEWRAMDFRARQMFGEIGEKIQRLDSERWRLMYASLRPALPAA